MSFTTAVCTPCKKKNKDVFVLPNPVWVDKHNPWVAAHPCLNLNSYPTATGPYANFLYLLGSHSAATGGLSPVFIGFPCACLQNVPQEIKIMWPLVAVGESEANQY
jgi:hypothetical protein